MPYSITVLEQEQVAPSKNALTSVTALNCDSCSNNCFKYPPQLNCVNHTVGNKSKTHIQAAPKRFAVHKFQHALYTPGPLTTNQQLELDPEAL